MNEERSRILELLAQGKINVSEAERLLDAARGFRENGEANPPSAGNGRKAKFLRVVVEGGDDNVNIRVPLALLRAGMQLAAVIPASAQSKIDSELKEKGVNLDFSNIKPESINDFVDAIGDLSVDVIEKSGEHVRVFCE